MNTEDTGFVARLVADLEAAVAQHRLGAIPTSHVELILQRYRQRLPEPRHVDPYYALDVTQAACQVLQQASGCTDWGSDDGQR